MTISEDLVKHHSLSFELYNEDSLQNIKNISDKIIKQLSLYSIQLIFDLIYMDKVGLLLKDKELKTIFLNELNNRKSNIEFVIFYDRETDIFYISAVYEDDGPIITEDIFIIETDFYIKSWDIDFILRDKLINLLLSDNDITIYTYENTIFKINDIEIGEEGERRGEENKEYVMNSTKDFNALKSTYSLLNT